MSTFKMGFKNLFVFIALLLLWKVCRVYGQAARVEYINQPYTSSVATTVQATPQLVVPAIYAPVVSPYDSYIQDSVPNVPSYNGFNGYSNYAPSYSQPMLPIIIDDDDNDNWHHLLYFLIFAMRNRRNCGSGNFGGCSGGFNGGCGCGGGCNGGCGGYNGGNNGGCGCGGYNGGYNGGCGCGGYNGGYNGGCGCGGNCGSNYGGGYDNSGFCGCGNYGGYSNNNFGSGCSYIPYPIPCPVSGPYPYSFPGFGGYPDNSCGCIEETCQPGQGTNDINLYIRTDSSCSC